MADEVELSVQGEVALIQLRRPSHGNALRGPMFDTIRKLGLKLADAPPRYVVLAGEGSDFCAGLDADPADPLYQSFEPMIRSRDAHRAQELVSRVRSAFDTLGRLPCPVIAAIEGRCHGPGLELALVADLRIGSSAATYRLADGRAGLLTGFGGLARTTVLLGIARATDLALTGATLDADAAAAIGLVTRTTTPGGALSAALELVQELRRSSPVARTQTLLATRALHHKLAAELFDAESQGAARTWIAGEWHQALLARRDGREPTW